MLGIGMLIFLTADVCGQGCSDAGFCTLNSFKPQADGAQFNNMVKVGVNAGAADHSIVIVGSYLEFNRKIGNKLSGNIKLTQLSQSGNGIHATGFSDVFVDFSYRMTEKFTITAGTKVPLMDGSRSMNGLALPMDYQSSLGTLDLILGAGYRFDKLQLVLAVQRPLVQNNNAFFATDYVLNSPLRDFQSTNQFQRKSDVLIRISYPMFVSKKITVTPSLLPIYHLGVDKYTDESGERQEITGSDGLTLNANLYLDWMIGKSSVLQFSVGTPFIVRDSRPDGLTRSVIANCEYAIKF